MQSGVQWHESGPSRTNSNSGEVTTESKVTTLSKDGANEC